jgi:hypothetical protein
MAKWMFWAIVGVGCLILAGLGMWEYDQRIRLGREKDGTMKSVNEIRVQRVARLNRAPKTESTTTDEQAGTAA